MTGVQRLSIRSFLHHGHDVTIFTYGQIEAPDGVKFADAGEIIPESEIFKSFDTYAAFSDVFRYRLLAQSDFIWSDADNVCLRADWNFGEYILHRGEPYKLNGNVLAYPKDSLLAKTLVDEAVYEKDKVYDNLGPILLTRIVSQLGLGHLVMPEKTFNPIYYGDFRATYNPGRFKEVMSKVSDSHAVSLSNYLLKYHNLDRENFPEGSAMAYWDETFK